MLLQVQDLIGGRNSQQPTPVSMAVTSQAGDMQSAVTTSGVDPFLGQGGNTQEAHARQNSADSGLGAKKSLFWFTFSAWVDIQKLVCVYLKHKMIDKV